MKWQPYCFMCGNAILKTDDSITFYGIKCNNGRGRNSLHMHAHCNRNLIQQLAHENYTYEELVKSHSPLNDTTKPGGIHNETKSL